MTVMIKWKNSFQTTKLKLKTVELMPHYELSLFFY